MTMAAFTFPPDAAAFLPMTPGVFAFAKARSKAAAAYRLEVASVGELPVPSGRLVLVDPLIHLAHEGNAFVHVPPGVHLIGQTWAHLDQGAPRVAYISLILDKVQLGARRKWQKQQMDEGQDPSVPASRLRLLHLTVDGHPLSTHEASPDTLVAQAGVEVRSGTLGLVDAQAVHQGLPPDRLTLPQDPAAVDWYDQFQAPEVPGSWMDALDVADERYRKGAANVPLPRNPALRLGLSYAGWSDQPYAVIGEYASDKTGDMARPAEQLIAVHVDLRALPSPLQPLSVPPGWAG